MFAGGAEAWWRDVIRRTAVGAGAHPQGKRGCGPVICVLGTACRLAVDASLTAIVPRLMQRFSGSKGYKYFDDVVPTRSCYLSNVAMLKTYR